MDQIIILFNMFMDFFINSYNFVIANLTLDWIIKFIVLYFFIIWWAFIVWIVKDITNRTTNIFVQVISILIVIFLTPIFWLPIYFLIRPRSTIFEKYYENAEFSEKFENEDDEEYSDENEDKDEEIDSQTCPSCAKKICKDFLLCPYCEYRLTKQCNYCHKNMKLDWKICPYCGNHEKEIKVKKIKIEKKEK